MRALMKKSAYDLYLNDEQVNQSGRIRIKMTSARKNSQRKV